MHCSMKGDILNAFSMAWGVMYLPPAVLKISFLRSVMRR